jgi:hypothetical protein
MTGDEMKTQGLVKSWLKGKISQLEAARSASSWQIIGKGARVGAE